MIDKGLFKACLSAEVITFYHYPGDPLPSFSCSERVTIASKMKKINSTREVGFDLCLKLKKRCIVGKKRATEVG